MQELRAVLVMVPPLLADLIQQVLTDRVRILIVAEVADPADIAHNLGALVPDVMILGPAVSRATVAASAPARTRILAMSLDLTALHGPGDSEVAPFTTDNLIAALQRIANDLDPASPPNADPRMYGGR